MLRARITTIIRPQVCLPRKPSILLVIQLHFPNSWRHHGIAHQSAITERGCVRGKQRKFTISRTPLISNSLKAAIPRSEEHTSELQSRGHLVCRLLLEKKK